MQASQKKTSHSWAGLTVLVLILATALVLAYLTLNGQTGDTLACGGTEAGTITADNFSQQIALKRNAGDPFMVSMYRTGDENPLNPFLLLQHPNGEIMAEDNDSALEDNARLVLPGLPETGTYTLIATREGVEHGASEGTFALRAYCEPRPVLCNSAVSGEINSENPLNWWILEAEPGMNVTVRMFKAGGGDLDPVLFVHAPEGWMMTYDDDGLGDHNAIANFWVEQPGPYSILAARFDVERGVTNGFYEMEVQCEGDAGPQQQQSGSGG
jgi:hypothetical protein